MIEYDFDIRMTGLVACLGYHFDSFVLEPDVLRNNIYVPSCETKGCVTTFSLVPWSSSTSSHRPD